MIPTIPVRAGGDINPARFIKLDTSADSQVLEADADEVTIGISEEGTKEAPQGSNSTLHAESGDNVEFFGLGAYGRLELGTGGATAGDLLKSDADGKGVGSVGDGEWYGAQAVESGSAGEKIRVRCVQGYFAA